MSAEVLEYKYYGRVRKDLLDCDQFRVFRVQRMSECQLGYEVPAISLFRPENHFMSHYPA